MGRGPHQALEQWCGLAVSCTTARLGERAGKAGVLDVSNAGPDGEGVY